ncbi:MAG: asparagine synthase (glutamine-hydrolyzing) [Candidatus Eisenbacteria bacterium]|uniref:asparagine synthase (glutamine-hydrolyzing) n=1 Tax=Eiseniibacteriota bacterium TaxID=2212470 RepID=A0A933W324_UNCEI|nr:asparagine synthase (glutamine-hydrolyzing) [Candidatus Eisenbacteria bacterium]
MCGIAGYVGRPGAAAPAVQRWGETLAHRGPDDFGIAVLDRSGVSVGRDVPRITPDCDAVLWHRRLSILDLSPAGWQPMSSRDGRWHLVLNGEIYNYVELREELKALGATFHSTSDTEVLLEAWQRWGAAVLPRLVGMFAFAILDVRERTLTLARDPFGIKPLVWSAGPGWFAFASEPKALLELPGLSRKVDAQRVYDYVRFGLTDHGDATLLEAVRQLPAAHGMTVPLDAPVPGAPVRYWELRAEQTFEGSFDDAAARFRELFLDSVRLHLRSDVPVGAALSGGIDSSAIVTAMRAVEPNLELHAFSYVADDPALSEERWVRLVAERAKAVVHTTRASAGSLQSGLAALLRTQDDPFGSTSIHAQHRVFELAKQHGITVMLDGQGADELLGGYLPHSALRFASLVRQGDWGRALSYLRVASRTPGRRGLALWAAEFLVPPVLQGPLRRLVGQELVPAWLDAGWFAARGVRTDSGKYTFGRTNRVQAEQLVRATTWSSLPMLLRYEDRNSMAWSIESRVPFVTPALAEFAFSLPEEYVIDDTGLSKAVFRRAMRGLVPDEILDRRDKIGFATPEHDWLLELSPMVERLLSSERVARMPALRPEVMRAHWRGMLEKRVPRDFRAWRWLNLIEWAERVGADFS